MFNLYSANGALVVSRALAGSPDGINIQNLSWANGKVTVTTDVPHPFAVLGTFPLTIQGVTPATYNGVKQCFILSDTTFWYDAAEYPGAVSDYGHAHSQVDLVSGYFDTSTLVYRSTSRQFEVSP
jgi:hypothetical protein